VISRRDVIGGVAATVGGLLLPRLGRAAAPIRRRRLGGGKTYPMLGAAFAGGSAQFMGIADNAAFSMGAGAKLTICAWLFPTSFATTTAPISKGGSFAAGTLEYGVQVNAAGSLALRVSDGTTVRNSNGVTLTLNAWNFAMVQYDGTNLFASLNGGAFTTGVAGADIQDLANDFRLGLFSGGGSPYSGSLDAVGLWKRALTANEVSQLYKGGVGMAYGDLFGSLLTNLVDYYDLDDAGGSGATWIGRLGNNVIAGTGAAAPTSAPGKR
jgi:Concanavalin A-like lectin/glucanases superfamily